MRSKRKLYSLLGSSLIIAGLITGARAEEPQKLTEDAIRRFYQETTTAMQGPYEDYIEYLQKKMHDRFKGSLLILNTGQTVSLTKQGILDQARTDYEGVRAARVEVQIETIKIDDGGKMAYIKDRETIHGMTVPHPGGSTTMNQSAACEDYLVLTPGVGIQVAISNCQTTISQGNP